MNLRWESQRGNFSRDGVRTWYSHPYTEYILRGIHIHIRTYSMRPHLRKWQLTLLVLEGGLATILATPNFGNVLRLLGAQAVLESRTTA